MSERTAREFVVRVVTTHIENDPSAQWYHQAREAARDAIRNDMGSPHTVADYLPVVRGQAGKFDRWQYAQVVGQRIADMLREEIDKAIPRPEHSNQVHLMLLELLDLGDAQLWTEVGERFLPEEDDFDPAERGKDEGDDGEDED